MARRIDWDIDDDEDGFEILDRTAAETFEVIENESFEIISGQNQPPLVTKTNAKSSSVTFFEKSIPIDQPLCTESPPQSSYLPSRYGSAAIIPYNENSDLKSILTRKSNLPSSSSNDLIAYLQKEKTKSKPPMHNQFQQIVIDNAHERERHLHLAKQIQQDFLNAIHLD